MKVRRILTSTILPLLLTGASHAASTSFTSTSGFWDVGANWTAGIPGEQDDALITLGNSIVIYRNSSAPQLKSLTIDAAGGATLVHALNDSLKATTLTVGNTQTGAYNQSAGQVTAATLVLGSGTNGTGNYTMTGGSLLVTGDTPASHLIIGDGNGATGNFNLSNGSVTASGITVGSGNTEFGWASSGTFVQSGGTVDVTSGAGEVIVGDSSSSAGRYTISGGLLTANQLYVGVHGANPTSGDRSFVQTGGTVTINDNLVLGGFDGGSTIPTGSYTLSGSEASSVLKTSKVWVGLSGSGTFTQEGGTHNVTLGNQPGDGSLLIAAAKEGSQGVYNMKSGALNATAIFVGYFGEDAIGGKGTINHSGGTITASQLVVDYGGSDASLGRYVMTGGVLKNDGKTNTSIYNAGDFVHNAGTVEVNLGAENDPTGTVIGLRNDGKYTLAGGIITGSAEKVNNGTFSGYGTISGSGKFTNSGTMTFQNGNSTISAPVENSVESSLEVRNSVAVFDGTVVNKGLFKTTGATVIFNGPFSNAGQYYSDPSVNTFNGGYINEAGGYLTVSEPGDVFRIGGVFDVKNANSTLWNTKTATLEFFKPANNATGDHQVTYQAVDYGSQKDANGFLGYQSNLSWGKVVIDAGNQLKTSGGGALYTDELAFGSTNLTQVSTQVGTFTGDLKIYYNPVNNPEFQGRTFSFGTGGGVVIPVVETRTSYIGSNDFWDVSTSWSGGVVPGTGPGSLPSDVAIDGSGSTVFYRSSSAPQLNSITIDAAGGATLVHALNDSLKATTITVGESKSGSYTQSAGQVTAATLVLGSGTNGTGNYTMTGGSLLVTGDTPASHLIIGDGNGATGNFNLSNGSVTASGITVGSGNTEFGWASSGTFVQSGGTVDVTSGAGEVLVGDSSSSAGRYTISGGLLTANQLYVGVHGANPTSGDRSFVQTGGTVTINDNLILGGFDGGSTIPTGSYTLSGSEASSVLNTSKVWVGLSGSGTFTQEGGTHNVIFGNQPGDGSLLIAAAKEGSQGVYNMKSGALNATAIFVGYFGEDAIGGKGTINHSGGTITASQLVVDYGGGDASLGRYVMTGGVLKNDGKTDTSIYNAGDFVHNAGTVEVNLGAENDPTGTVIGLRNDGKYTLAGGTIHGSAEKVNNGTFTGYGTISGSGKFTNSGTMTFQNGNSTVSAPLKNSADSDIEVLNSVAVFDGAVENFGDFKTTGATVVFNSSFSNAGEYFSDPSVNTFNGGYLNIEGGRLTATTGDVFRIGLGFSVPANTITDRSLWSTETAILEFYKGTTNSTGNHSLIYAGLDFGGASNAQGFLGYQDNLSWGEVIIGAGNQLVTSGGGALYTEKLTLGSSDLAQIQAQVASFSGDLHIYYDPADNPQLQNLTFAFGSGGGSIAPVPEPSAALLIGIGAIGLGFRRRRAA